MCETCGDCLVVEHNGDVYNCDHFVYPEYLLGNILERPLAEIYQDPKRFRFGVAKRESLPLQCKKCRFYFACRGECPKHRFDRTALRPLRQAQGPQGPVGEPVEPPVYIAKNTLCLGLKDYFRHTQPYFEKMRDILLLKKAPAGVMPWARKQLSKNG